MTRMRVAPWTAVLTALLFVGCSESPAPERLPIDQSTTQSKSTERPVESITHFTEQTELFVEFPMLMREQASPFAAHLTRLDTFKAVKQGRVTVVLSGGDAPEERFEVTQPQAPGIFRPMVTPNHAGRRELTLLLASDGFSDRHALGTVTVFPGVEAAARAGEKTRNDKGDTISFLKEQQWHIDFATSPVGVRTLQQSIAVNGVIRARSDGESYITAPTGGRLITSGEDFPQVGREVKRDQLLAAIAPRLGGDADATSLELAVARARFDLEHAERERKRLEGLFKVGAVAEKLVIAARHEEYLAKAESAAALRRLEQFRRIQHAQGAGNPGSIAVRSPIDGTVAQGHVAPGAFLEEGQKMFHIVNLDRLWLEVQIPEAAIARVRETTGAWFEIEGFAQPFEVSQDSGGRVVALGGVVHPESRTVSLILEFPNPQRRLSVGLFARVHVLRGETAMGPVVPVSAIVDDNGQEVAYIQVEGEAFERRVLTLGVRDGAHVQVLAGLEPGERVVTRGAYFVRLAASSTSVPAHGHVH
jgi:RND family efflux transporter, MFP subunit